MSEVEGSVKDYYGKTLTQSADLATNACCLAESVLPKAHRAALSRIHPDVVAKFYGCGSPIPGCLEGRVLLDLGCGSACQFTGPEGRVIGVDMTPEQLSVAESFRLHHIKQFGLKEASLEFRSGRIQDLKSLGVEDNSVDVVISNCVVNLVPNKEEVFREVWRVLKEGGELYFSDIYSDRRVPEELQADKQLWGECLSGALYLEDFRRVMAKVGFQDCRVISKSRVTIGNPAIQKHIESVCPGLNFYSCTIRAFKIPSLEDRCEDYGQTATYKGEDKSFSLDQNHEFAKGVEVRVCRNTADMLQKSRFSKLFDVSKEGAHKGLFDCSGASDKCSSGACC